MVQRHVQQPVADQPPQLPLLDGGGRPVGEVLLEPLADARDPAPQVDPQLYAHEQRGHDGHGLAVQGTAEALLGRIREGLVQLQLAGGHELVAGHHLEADRHVRPDGAIQDALLEVVVGQALGVRRVPDLDDHVRLQSWTKAPRGTRMLAMDAAWMRSSAAAGKKDSRPRITTLVATWRT